MANEPSLSELTNISSDANLGTGDTGTVTNDGSNLVRLLNQTAEFKANQDREKYNTFLENLNGIYKNADDIASMDVATEDRDLLKKQVNDVLSGVYKNPKDFFQNAGSPQGQELHKKLAQLRMDATESKQNKLFDAAHREYLGRNPELNTPENKSNVDNYLKAPLGKRKPFTLNLPGLYDPIALGNEINTAVKQDFATPGATADGKFTFTEKGTRYDKDKYNKIAENMYYLPDARGQQLRSTLQSRFQSLPKDIQDKYKDSKDPVKDWYLELQGQYRKPDQVTKDDYKANPFALESQKSIDRFALENLKNRNDENREIKVAQVKEGLKNSPTPDQANFLLKLTAGVLDNTSGELAVEIEDGKWSKEKLINASPVILKMFAKPITTTSKTVDGLDVETTSEKSIPPDALTRTPDGGIRALFYQKEGDKVVFHNDKRVIESSQVIPKEQVISVLGKEYMDKKQLPNAVSYVNQVLDQYGGDINKYISSTKQQTKADDQAAKQEQNVKFSVKGKSYTQKQLKEFGYTDDQIQEAIKNGTIKKQ